MANKPRRSQALQILERTPFQAGDVIFREGDPGNRAYVLQQGTVNFYKHANGEDVLVGTAKQGGIFGEMALIDNEPRMASAVAADHCVCIVVSEVMFRKKLDSLDPFLAGILRIMVENIRSIQDAKLERHAVDQLLNTKPPVVEVRDVDGEGADEDKHEVE